MAHDCDGEYANEKRAHYKKIKGAENMRKRYEKLLSDINEGKYTGRELVFMGAVCFC